MTLLALNLSYHSSIGAFESMVPSAPFPVHLVTTFVGAKLVVGFVQRFWEKFVLLKFSDIFLAYDSLLWKF